MNRLKSFSLLVLTSLITVACGTEENIINSNTNNSLPTENKTVNSKSYVDLKKSSLFKGKTIKKSSSYKPVIRALNSVNTNFRFKSKQWHLRDTKALTAWETTTGNKDLIVAVIDSGVDYNHPDLKNRVIQGPDFSDSDNDPMDEGGHGTHVAGIIAGNGSIKGIAPNVKIMALKVFSEQEKKVNTYNTTEGIAEAILYATENGASIINMSLGGSTLMSGKSRALDSAINEAVNKGLIVFTAAGNESYSNVSTQTSVQNNINQIPVIATDEMQKISTFSTYSNLDHPKAISAPGVNIYSAMPTSLACKKSVCEMPYQYMDGTSMATPVAAGTMALIESAMYEDYVRVTKEFNSQGANIPIFTFREFFHTRQKDVMGMFGIAISPARLAEQILFSYTNKDNSYMQVPQGMVYPAKRDAVFGYGIVDAGAATKAASQVFSSVYLSQAN
jgi:subtilisin family serine protease